MYVKLIISSSVSRFGTISFTCSRTILKWMRSCMTLFLVMLLFVGSLRAQKQDGYFGDSTLYALSMQMFDSIRTPAFFDMWRKRSIPTHLERHNPPTIIAKMGLKRA